MYIYTFLTDDQIIFFRNIEKINKKLVSLTYSIIFNETCLRERLLPTYTNIHERLLEGANAYILPFFSHFYIYSYIYLLLMTTTESCHDIYVMFIHICIYIYTHTPI